MHITEEMLKVAVTKSVEAGLLPRRALKEDFSDAQEMMRAILQSTLESMSVSDSRKKEQPFASKTASSSSKTKLIPVELQNCY